MAGRLPPPPRSLLNNRELYIWLSKIHAILDGQDSSYELSGDVISATSSSNADAAELEKSVQGAELMQLRSQMGEMQKQIDQLTLLSSSAMPKTPETIPAPVLSMGEMQKQLDQMALMIAQRQSVVPDTIPSPVPSIGEINKRIDEALLWQSP